MSEAPATDPRPPVWIGHVGPHVVPDIEAAVGFYETIGMRTVARPEKMAIMELRGGTHLIVREGDGGEAGSAPFDLMVDDVDATHATYGDAGLAPSGISRGTIHDSFTVTDPGGWVVTINSSHAIGPV